MLLNCDPLMSCVLFYREMEDERKARIKEQQTAHIPEPLKGR